MPELDTREVLRRAVADEPDFSYDLDAVLVRGRSGRRRHRARVGSLAAVGVCAVAGAAFVLTPALLAGTAPARTPVSAGSGGGPAVNAPTDVRPPSAAPQGPTNALDRTIAAAVSSASPDDFVLDLWDGEASSGGVDGTADDGSGAASISVGLSTGSQQVHPCDDAEFVDGGTCTERTLASGAVLTQRGRASHDGIEYIEVALTYPDGSGVNADASNALLVPGKAGSDGGAVVLKPHFVVSRAHPTYSVAELTAVVLAVDKAVN